MKHALKILSEKETSVFQNVQKGLTLQNKKGNFLQLSNNRPKFKK